MEHGIAVMTGSLEDPPRDVITDHDITHFSLHSPKKPVIVISGIITVTDQNRAEVVACLSAMRKTTLASDPGVVAYRFGFDIENSNDIHVYEEWESTELLKSHLQKPHMDTFRELRKKHNLPTSGFSRWRADELGEF